MLETLGGDRLLSVLMQNSGLTRVQIDTLLAYSTVKREYGSLAQMIEKRDGYRVTKGSFLHSLSQARKNLRVSIYSILLMGYLGLIDDESTQGLVKVVKLLRNLKEFDPMLEFDEAIELVDKMCDRLLAM